MKKAQDRVDRGVGMTPAPRLKGDSATTKMPGQGPKGARPEPMPGTRKN